MGQQKRISMICVAVLCFVTGCIDEVLQQATMTWVQPRILDRHQVTNSM